MRAEVRAKDHEPVGITEHFKPGNEEIAAILPPGLARWLLARGARSTSRCTCAARRSGASRGSACWPACAGGGRTPRATPRSRQKSSAGSPPSGPPRLSAELAREIAECARLIKGYGDTHKRGSDNYRRIAAEVIEPALAGRMAAARGGRRRRQRARGGAGRSRGPVARPDSGRHRLGLAAAARRRRMTPAAADAEALMQGDMFARGLGIELVEAGLGRAVTRVTVGAGHLNFNGLGHGGLTFTLADAAFGIACNSHGLKAGGVDVHMVYFEVDAAGRRPDRSRDRDCALEPAGHLPHRRDARRRHAGRRHDRHRRHRPPSGTPEPMPLESTHDVTVEWGDCDPAGIVYYPAYFKWFDQATYRLFLAAGLRGTAGRSPGRTT